MAFNFLQLGMTFKVHIMQKAASKTSLWESQKNWAERGSPEEVVNLKITYRDRKYLYVTFLESFLCKKRHLMSMVPIKIMKTSKKTLKLDILQNIFF